MTETPDARAALDSAQGHLDADELTAALGESERAVQLAPQWAEAHNLRGIVLDAMGRTVEAMASYREALRWDPGFADAAANLAELRQERGAHRSLCKRVAAVALPVLILAAVVVTVTALEARRGPDWRLTLNNYLAQRAQRLEVLTVEQVVAARQPANFVQAMGVPVPGGPVWESVRPVVPPQAVQCVLLERNAAAPDESGRQVVYVAFHSDSLYHVGWRVYEGPQTPFPPQLQADLQAIGCNLQLP
jgi:tetratricopeptide (TPR) repeat protein